MTQTEHLQSVILTMMKDIDKFCRDYEIEYYLFGGTTLGAKRHKGFIPWDDDIDIVLLPEQYDNFIKLCKEKLDKNKYSFQEGTVDWPEHFSKIRLKGTHIKEFGEYYIGPKMDGIYIDVFRVDYASNSKIGRAFQYMWGKLWLAHNMNCKGFKPNSISKKFISLMAKPLKLKSILKFVQKRYLKYNDSPTNWVSDVMGRTRWHNAFVPRSVYGKPTLTQFEDTELYAQEDMDKYLSITYGDYMQLPPVEKRVGLHIIDIDFGKY